MDPIASFRKALNLFSPMHSAKTPFTRSFLRISCLGVTALLLTTATCAYAESEEKSGRTQRQWPPQITLSAPDSQKNEIVTNLYVWRHGETSSNISKILSGGGDTTAALTDQGEQQVIDLAAKISRQGLSLLVTYSSDLLRAMQTAAPISSTIVPSPQLREILHGKYERTPAKDRGERASLLFKQTLDQFEGMQKSIVGNIQDGILDRFHFWKIHPMSGRVVADDAPVIDVVSYFASNCQEPETPYELYLRVHAEFIRIAKEGRELGLNEVGISTHGAVLASLINVAQFGNKNVFIPVHYQPEEFQRQGTVVMPIGAKVHNCALAHFRYWHKSQQLEFCGLME